MLVNDGGEANGVDADGFIEMENGFVLTEGGIDGLPATLHVFERLPAGVTRRSSLTIDADIAQTRIGLFGRSLALFQPRVDGGARLLVYDTAASSTSTAPPVAELAPASWHRAIPMRTIFSTGTRSSCRESRWPCWSLADVEAFGWARSGCIPSTRPAASSSNPCASSWTAKARTAPLSM
jgi:hypothetical protein